MAIFYFGATTSLYLAPDREKARRASKTAFEGSYDKSGEPFEGLNTFPVVDCSIFAPSAPSNVTAIKHLSEDRLCQAWRVPF